MNFLKTINSIVWLIITASIFILIWLVQPSIFSNFKKFSWPSTPISHANDHTDFKNTQNSVYDGTTLIQAPGVDKVKRHCISCHSSQLITQNRMSKTRWEDNIRWMQETQGLWDLGRDHDIIINYLTTNYSPIKTGRRNNLNIEHIKWYILERD